MSDALERYARERGGYPPRLESLVAHRYLESIPQASEYFGVYGPSHVEYEVAPDASLYHMDLAYGFGNSGEDLLWIYASSWESEWKQSSESTDAWRAFAELLGRRFQATGESADLTAAISAIITRAETQIFTSEIGGGRRPLSGPFVVATLGRGSPLDEWIDDPEGRSSMVFTAPEVTYRAVFRGCASATHFEPDCTCVLDSIDQPVADDSAEPSGEDRWESIYRFART